jgi:CRP-like cAMP-binding protein
MDKQQTLAKVPLFSKLSPRQLERLAELSTPKSFPKDSLLIKEGTVGLGLIVIISGRVEVYKGEGESRTTLGVLESGSIVGEMALVDGSPREATVRALEPTETLLLSRDSFDLLLRQDPEVAVAILGAMAQRMRASNQKIAELQTRVGQAAAEVTTEDGDLLLESGPRERTRSYFRLDEQRSSVEHMLQAERAMVRAGVDLVNGWFGFWGTALGGLSDEARRIQGGGAAEVISELPRRYFHTVTTMLDEGLRSLERLGSEARPEARRDTRSDVRSGAGSEAR